MSRRMADRGFVEFVEEWQTGVLQVVGSGFAGVLAGAIGGSIARLAGGVVGFVGGSVTAFLAISYLRYGRCLPAPSGGTASVGLRGVLGGVVGSRDGARETSAGEPVADSGRAR